MSYDLFVYSEQAGPITKDALKADLENQGWKIALLSDGVDELLNAEGPLEADAVVAGWDAADEGVADFAALIAQGNVQGLMALAAESEAAVGCAISVTVPYSLSSDCTSEEVRQLAEAWGAEYVEARDKARSHYHVGTGAGRGAMAFDFQEQVWRVVGDLVGGLAEDPQEGTYEIKAPR